MAMRTEITSEIAVDQMLGANRRDFEVAALKWIAGIGG